MSCVILITAAAVVAAGLHASSNVPVLENGILSPTQHLSRKDNTSPMLLNNTSAYFPNSAAIHHANSSNSAANNNNSVSSSVCSVPCSVHNSSNSSSSCDQHNNIGGRCSTTPPSISSAPSPVPHTPPISQPIDQQHNSSVQQNSNCLKTVVQENLNHLSLETTTYNSENVEGKTKCLQFSFFSSNNNITYRI